MSSVNSKIVLTDEDLEYCLNHVRKTSGEEKMESVIKSYHRRFVQNYPNGKLTKADFTEEAKGWTWHFLDLSKFGT